MSLLARHRRHLDALDTAIRQTEAIIAKLKQVKQGLPHDPLTRDIDANGELRPPQIEAPRPCKQSLLEGIEVEIGSVSKMRAQKSGRMDDLLTGRFRVNPLPGAASPL